MSDTETTNNEPKDVADLAPDEKIVKDFDISDIEAPDTVDMTVMAGERRTDWVWTFAGYTHPKTIAQQERLSRDNLDRERAIEMAQVNRKKWKGDEITTDQVRARTVNFVLERLLGWSPVKMNGEDYPFSIENARVLLSDRKRISLLNQALEFLGEEKLFTTGSPKN
ncbi:hypothetical protein [Parvibaculum sp.]|uniref:hypothetical protein n=1 Tax=Parvibaculum sp. TaxID=2024848 RepID=UPI001D5F8AA0|nr:hypothetical protein [Parvibaculum sp.]MBX3490908.1 hypothetical protein [Parvibaculum sp.]